MLVSEVMLHQTQVPRVAAVFDDFLARFPTPEAMAAAGPAAVITAWGRLGYPRRARRLWEAAQVISSTGWPDDLEALPGVGRYTARAIDAQVDDDDVVAIEVNVRRVVQRVEGVVLTDRAAEDAARRVGGRLRGRDRLLALMDLGALVCRARAPECATCPLRARCATRGVLDGEARARQAPFEGSFRQRRGVVLAALRRGPSAVADLDADALASLVTDGLAVVDGPEARLP
ncbi:MAG TPA: A/G-specific adenine glycosylase [Acidimicrobiia bacterium]|nr:A/G-specific adenine glycosylase [Acidimicrobiia bacterium]